MLLEEEFSITIPDAENEKIFSAEDAINFMCVGRPYRGGAHAKRALPAPSHAPCKSTHKRAHTIFRSSTHPNAK